MGTLLCEGGYDVPSKIGLCAAIAAIFIVGDAIAPSANAAPPDDACSLLTQAQVSVGRSESASPSAPGAWPSQSGMVTGSAEGS